MKGSDRLKWIAKGCQQALLSTFLLLVGATAQAQITPDGTLGGERSQVVPRALGGASIEGGAIRGSNLFHSFSEFNIGNQQSVYFSNPTGIQNILTRVTGNTASNINGTLGIDGAANLFLLNPNGIIFGQNARLDVRGSFVGSTANGIGFGTQGEFSATNPQEPSLLTVQPSALLFTQINSGAIKNRAFLVGGIGQNLSLIGGDIQLEKEGDPNSMLSPGGHIELAAIAGIGTVEFNSQGRLNLSSDLQRGDIALKNAQIAAVGDNLGSVLVYAHNLTLSEQSRISRNGIGVGVDQGQAGDIFLDATGTIFMTQRSIVGNTVRTGETDNAGNVRINAQSLSMSDNSELTTSVFGRGNSGRVVVNVTNQANLTSGSRIISNVAETGRGNSGGIEVQASSLTMSNGAALSANTSGQGNSGNIEIRADHVSLDSNALIISAINRGIGDSEGIQITTGSLSLNNQAVIGVGGSGKESPGNLEINATNSVSLRNQAEIFSFTNSSSGADIQIETARLLLSDSIIDAATFGSGKGGHIRLRAKDQFSLDSATIVNRVASNGSGNGGEISINAGSLSITNSGVIVSETQGQGNVGKIDIKANTLDITNFGIIGSQTLGSGSGGDVAIDIRDRTFIQGGTNGATRRSSITNGVSPTATGSAGSIELKTGTLEMRDRAQIISVTEGRGNAGNIKINASGSVVFDDASVIDRVSEGGIGNSGSIEITATSLSLLNGAQIDSSTFSQGNSGNVVLKTRDSILIDGFVKDKTTPEGARSSTVFTEVYDGARGNGGDINIETRSLIITNGGQIDAKVRGTGNSGDIKIVAQDQLVLDGERADGTLGSRIITSLNVADVVGKSGNIEINTGSLSVTKGAQILTNTLGRGNAGNVTIKADRVVIDGFRRDPEGEKLSRPNTIFIFPSAIFSNVARTGVGNGGNIEMTANTLSITNAGLITVGTAGRGNAGSIQVNAQSVFMDSSIISANSSSAQGEAGDIRVEASTLRLRDRSAILSETVSGRGGNIDLTIDEALILRQQSRISTTAGLEGSGGDGGNIRIQAESGFIIAPFQENSDISANAFTGIGGTVRINSQGIFGIQPRSQPSEKSDITASSQSGVQGQVSIAQPEVQPTQGVLELPTEVLDASNQMGQVCPRNSNVAKMGKFVVSGTGSLPPNPIEPLTGSTAIPLATIEGSPTTTIATLPTSNEPSIVEAQGWIRENGTVKLVAAATPNSPSTPAVCPTPQVN